MSHVFTVFNIGTGHTRAETNNTFTDLHNSCVGTDKFINDGPIHLFGNLAGKGMDRRGREAVAAILAARPRVVNLTGHSRGAVLCHMIANDLAESTDPAARGITEINMILLDPVNMSNHVKRGKTLGAKVKVGAYVSVVMENAGTAIFPSTTVKPLGAQVRERMVFQHLPGSHGSGTQCHSSAIGEAARAMIRIHLEEWGTQFAGGKLSALEAAESFARIHLDNPVKYSKRGLIRKRQITDNEDGMAASPFDPAHKIDTKLVKVAGSWWNNRAARITANFKSMARARGGSGVTTDFRNSPYFFNNFHAGCFRAAFPDVFNYFCMGQEQYARGVTVDLTRDLAAIDRTRYVRQSLQNLGMLD
jgi:hypothetical protein